MLLIFSFVCSSILLFAPFYSFVCSSILFAPFYSLCLLQGGRLDHADRMFISVEKAWGARAGQSDADLKESLPAMFYAPCVRARVGGNLVPCSRGARLAPTSARVAPPPAHGHVARVHPPPAPPPPHLPARTHPTLPRRSYVFANVSKLALGTTQVGAHSFFSFACFIPIILCSFFSLFLVSSALARRRTARW